MLSGSRLGFYNRKFQSSVQKNVIVAYFNLSSVLAIKEFFPYSTYRAIYRELRTFTWRHLIEAPDKFSTEPTFTAPFFVYVGVLWFQRGLILTTNDSVAGPRNRVADISKLPF